MPSTPPIGQRSILLVAVGLGVAVLLVLLVTVITHRTSAPPRASQPTTTAPPAAHGPLAPVYGGGVMPGQRRGGF
jgi:hypothetical protein